MADAMSAKRRKLDHAQDDENDALYAGGSYKSSMFKLQVDEMLAEVQPNYEKRAGAIDDALRRLKGLIEGIGDREALSVGYKNRSYEDFHQLINLQIPEATKLLQKSYKIAIPFPDPKPDKTAAYKLSYARPSNINVVGSYALKTMVRSDHALPVDMMVKMPESLFQEKDFLNYRYFYKRSYYLACIAAGLQESIQDQFTLNLEYLNGNSLQPILVAKPRSSE
jgi:U3 small nucleolar RNA-associated protein 22